MNKISITKLSKKLDIPSKALFDKMTEEKLIYKEDKDWKVTKKGFEYGGEIAITEKYGEFPIWPVDFNPFNLDKYPKTDLINVTTIGKELKITSQRLNLIFTEIGWIEKGIKGWTVTKHGKVVGGVQVEHESGSTYVMWPKTITSNKALLQSVKKPDGEPEKAEPKTIEQNEEVLDLNKFREKFPANMRTKDGHMVRSRAEVIIDNALYDYGLAHAYERKLPIEEDMYSDFYIPSKNGGKAVYVEFWGLENDEKYVNRKRIKQEIYKKYEFNLIELDGRHIENLDDYLPRMLLKFDIRVE